MADDDKLKVLGILSETARGLKEVPEKTLFEITAALDNANKAIKVAKKINGEEDNLKQHKELANLAVKVSLMKLARLLKNTGYY